MLFVIDNSVFLPQSNYHLFHSLDMSKIPYVKIKNKKQLTENLKNYKPNRFILSGSPIMFTKKEYNTYEDIFELNFDILEKYKNIIPIIGICFGAQLINIYYGGKLKKLQKEFCQTVSLNNGDRLFFCLNYTIKGNLSEIFENIYEIDNLGVVMFSTSCEKIKGFLFHPEKHEETWKYLHLGIIQSID